MIFPEVAAAAARPRKPRRTARQAVVLRTSEDQAAPPPERPAFIGERDTQATSDRSSGSQRASPAVPGGHRSEKHARISKPPRAATRTEASPAINRQVPAGIPSLPCRLLHPPPPDPTLADTADSRRNPGNSRYRRHQVRSAAARSPARRTESRRRPGPARCP